MTPSTPRSIEDLLLAEIKRHPTGVSGRRLKKIVAPGQGSVVPPLANLVVTGKIEWISGWKAT